MTGDAILAQTPILGYTTPDYIRRILPEDIARDFGIAPLAVIDEKLYVAADQQLSSNTQHLLEQSVRYPIKVIQVGFTQVKRFQSRLYEQTEPHPPRLPRDRLLETLGLTHINKMTPSSTDDPDALSFDFQKWLDHGWITESQWGQLMSMFHYLPNKTSAHPTPLNTLTAFVDIEPTLRREVQSFVPLWWANKTLFIGISDLEQVDQVSAITADWPCQTASIIIPPKLIDRLKKAHAGKKLFAPEVSEAQIAERLQDDEWVSEEEVQGAMTLSKTAGISLCQALLDDRPDLNKPWLEKSADLINTIAIHEDDLPLKFDHVLVSLFDIVPYEICRMLTALPLNFMNGVLVVGLSAIHPGVLDILKELSGYPVEPRLMTEEIINKWLSNIYRSLPHQPTFGIGIPQVEEFLVASHLVYEDQISRLELQRNLSVHDYLSRLTSERLLSDDDVAQIYAILVQTPHLTLDNIQINDDLVNRFSQSFLKEQHILPLLEYEGGLWVAVADPLQGRQLSELEEISHLEVWPFVVPKIDLDVTIHRYINFAPTDKSNRYLSLCIDYLVEQGVIKQLNTTEILEDVIEKDHVFDRVIQKYQVDKGINLYQKFADFRDVPFVSLEPEVEVLELINPLGNRIEQTRRRDPVDTSVARRLDYETANRLGALPITENKAGIQIAFADPLYNTALEELSTRFEVDLQPCITDRDALESAIERILGKINIGTLLVLSGLVTRNQLNDALNLAENTNSRIGRALIHRGYVTENQLYSFLSRQVDIPLFDLSQMELSKEVAESITPDQAWEWGVLPLAKDDQRMIVGIVDPVNQDSLEFVRANTDLEINPVLITENDFEKALEQLFQEHYTAQSVSALLSRAPDNSAARVLTKQQAIWMIAFAIIMVGLAIWNLSNFLIALNSIFTVIYIMMVIFKFFLVANAIGTNLEVPVTEEEIQALQDNELPIYTVLIPVYKEAAILATLLKSIENLDYPKIKLDVKVLLEQDDEETIQAFHDADPPDFIQGLIVPTSQPKTKPKACNYGLIHAKGDYVVIFDAEDKPDSDQIKKVVVAFNKLPANVICIQAKLNYYNRQQNLLTQWFSSEYSMWFDLFLPGLDASNMPIPLGGTSNHFKKYALLEAGAWDPFNMTEDADLGIRLYKLGYRTKIVDSTTYEEANSDVNNWVRQRSRWVKGHIQTWLVHMRHPIQLIRDIGLKAFFSFQMVIGGNIFTLIINPVYWLIAAVWFLFQFEFISSLFPGPIYYLGAFSLYFGNFAFTYINVAGAMRRGYYDMVKTALLSPIYWGLMSIGGWRGFFQLITKPHYWEKTIHGLDENAEEAEL